MEDESNIWNYEDNMHRNLQYIKAGRHMTLIYTYYYYKKENIKREF